MNDTLSAFARQQLKDGLAQCTDKQQYVFRLMYAGPTEPRLRTPEVLAEMRKANINDVVDAMPDDKLDWAMSQVKATLTNTAIAKAEPQPTEEP